MMAIRNLAVTAISALGLLTGCGEQQQYDQGVSDTEIKIGNTSPGFGLRHHRPRDRCLL
jgi:hypothetical protein